MTLLTFFTFFTLYSQEPVDKKISTEKDLTVYQVNDKWVNNGIDKHPVSAIFSPLRLGLANNKTEILKALDKKDSPFWKDLKSKFQDGYNMEFNCYGISPGKDLYICPFVAFPSLEKKRISKEDIYVVPIIAVQNKGGWHYRTLKSAKQFDKKILKILSEKTNELKQSLIKLLVPEKEVPFNPDALMMIGKIKSIQEQLKKEKNKDSISKLNNRLSSAIFDRDLYNIHKKRADEAYGLLWKMGKLKLINKSINLKTLPPLTLYSLESVLANSVKEYFCGDIRKLKDVFYHSDQVSFGQDKDYLKELDLLEEGTGDINNFKKINLKIVSSLEFTGKTQKYTYVTYTRSSEAHAKGKVYKYFYVGGALFVNSSNKFLLANRLLRHSDYFRHLQIVSPASINFTAHERSFSSAAKYAEHVKTRKAVNDDFVKSFREVVDKEAASFFK